MAIPVTFAAKTIFKLYTLTLTLTLTLPPEHLQWRSQPDIGHANANFSVFIDRIRIDF